MNGLSQVCIPSRHSPFQLPTSFCRLGRRTVYGPRRRKGLVVSTTPQWNGRIALTILSRVVESHFRRLLVPFLASRRSVLIDGLDLGGLVLREIELTDLSLS